MSETAEQGEELLVEQRNQPPDLGPPRRGAQDQRRLVDGLLEVFADRLAVDQREVLLLEPQHGVPTGSAIGVVDLRIRFEYPPTDTPTVALLVFETETGPIAAVVDNIHLRRGRIDIRQTPSMTVTSLLSILLSTLHITDDIVRGISKAEPSNIALVVLVVFLYGTLVLAERPSGFVIMLLVGLFAAGMPVIHMRGAHYGEIARSAGGFFFVWTLWALGGLGGVTLILSSRGLWSLRRGQPPR